ncbi:4'-phosphopantetheinyl transferase family protein [endosymbiont of Lamellibrachia barhami]|uniref:4'-phosphopantetheinyl transferase family protein n=1 Tax=endosymbiont of Lamellibrachia barhami TaxID=205975 RepID=UPI0015AB8C0D|nr:4'-phosphopantetheinyl transferase superfamily protein [endosymbiont of Lamellibrachia barhami]
MMSQPGPPVPDLTDLWLSERPKSAPDPGTLHLWSVDLDRSGFRHYLSQDELTRASRFSLDTPKSRFIAGRSALRSILGHYLATPPLSVRLKYGEHGKPELADQASDIHFNLAHSGHLAILAVSCDCPVGVDVERIRSRKYMLGISRRMFSREEYQRLASLPDGDQIAQFCLLWTRLEARQKCLGTGLFTPTLASDDSMPCWENFIPEPGFCGAISMQKEIPKTENWTGFKFQ